MSKQNGSKIKILVAGVAIANTNKVALKINGAMIDVTTKDSNGWKEVLPGLKSGSASGEGIVDFSVSTSPATIFTNIAAGTSCAIIFEDTAKLNAYSFTGYFESYDLAAGTEDNFTFSFSIIITGIPTQSATT